MEWLFLRRHFWVFMSSDEYHTWTITFVTFCYGCHISLFHWIIPSLIRCTSILFDFRLLQTVLMLGCASLVNTNYILCVDHLHCVGVHLEFDITIRSDKNLRLSLLRHYRRHIIANATFAPYQFRALSFWILLYWTPTCDALYGFLHFYMRLMLRLLVMLLCIWNKCTN